MNVISAEFALLTIAAAIIYYLLNHKYRTVYLAILSSAFIASYNYILLPYIIVYSLTNYFIGLKIPNSKQKMVLYRSGILINVIQLVVINYASFTIDPLFQLFNSDIQVSKLSEIIVPLGISYYTLQGIGYLINIKMGWEKPEKNFPDFFLYIIFFPKFLAGPIERSNHFLPQLKETKTFDERGVSTGLRIALIGFFKKIAIANQLAPYVMDAFADVHSSNPFSLWIIFILLPIYLYFDFSGYTDIAIGFARIFGINLLPNFNRPFFSENVTTFWKRFHISLASWFVDYIFRQTVFRRRKWGVYASMYAVFVTWMLFGIWHGAGWNFMVLGLVQVVAINYEFFTRKTRYKLFSRVPAWVNRWVGRVFVYVFYCFSLVFFFSPDLATVFDFLSRLFEVIGPVVIDDMSTKPFMVLIYIPIFFVLELLQNDYTAVYQKLENFWLGENRGSRVFRWIAYSTIITIIFIVGLKAEQFVYANF